MSRRLRASAPRIGVRTQFRMLAFVLLVGLADRPAWAWPAEGVLIAPNPTALQSRPHVIADPAGGAYVIWEDSRHGRRDLYGQRIGPQGLPSPGWPDTGLLISAGTGGRHHAGLLCSDGGLVTAVGDSPHLFRLRPDGTAPSGWPAAGFRAQLGAPLWVPGTLAWVADDTVAILARWAILLDGANTHTLTSQCISVRDESPAFVTDSLGFLAFQQRGLFVTDVQLLGDSPHRQFIPFGTARLSGHGDLELEILSTSLDGVTWRSGWTLEGRALATGDCTQQSAYSIADGFGGHYIAWADGRSAGPCISTPWDEDVRLQHILESGEAAPGWPMDGFVIGGSAEKQTSPVITRDSEGGLYVAWLDRGPVSEYRARALLIRLQANGAVWPGWDASGLPLAASSDDQGAVAVVADSRGGVFVKYNDRAMPSIVLHHVLPDGSRDPSWPLAGRHFPRRFDPEFVCSDGRGGCYLAYAVEHPSTGQGQIVLHQFTDDVPVPAAQAEGWVIARPDRAELVWSGAALRAPELVVQRSQDQGAGWIDLGAPIRVMADRVAFVDEDVTPDQTYGWRVRGATGEVLTREVWERMPPASGLAIFAPNPMQANDENVILEIAVVTAGPGLLQVMDLQGRVLAERSFESAGPGRYRVPIHRPLTSSGLHWLRVTHSGESVTRRLAILR